jgi:glycosyltransferase involved in cell wall biosynthesis
LLVKAQQADVVILQRRLPIPWQLHALRRAAKHLIFDFDDAIFGRDSYASRGVVSARRERRFAAVCRAADVVVAGNAYLAEHTARWLRSDKVRVIPTCVNPELYRLARHERKAGDAQLVWVGSSSTLKGLEAVRPMLEGLGRNVPDLTLKLVCDRFLHLDHVPVMAVPWTEAGEAAELADADIGICHMPDDDWSRGKCGLKVLQYMAAGLPVVANRVGVHREIVLHGETGFLADTDKEWQEAVRLLANNAELRRRLGAAGRLRVEAEYSTARGAALWRDMLDGLPAGRAAA